MHISIKQYLYLMLQFSKLFLVPTFLLLYFSAGCSKNEDETVAEDVPSATANPYGVTKIVINTKDAAPVKGKEKADYVDCTIQIDADAQEWDLETTGRIRGRGNSTWLWYPKKPYRLKLDEKAQILGLDAEKDWVLLANYRDPTHLMHTVGFALGKMLKMPYTNNTRYVEVVLNDDYIGLYQLTEQVEQGENRVNIDDAHGLLISLDADDGPALNPSGGDNFFSAVYRMPVCVKYPEDPATGVLQSVKSEFQQLENAVRAHDYDAVEALLDVSSFIDYMLIQELVYNVEVAAPRSIFMFRDKGGRWTMGPLWDFDAGFDFDWATMTTGHDYFANFRELVLGTEPVSHKNGYVVPEFFTDMFRNKRFVSEYKARWAVIKDLIMSECWDEVALYASNIAEAQRRDALRWPIDKQCDAEQTKMYKWLENRILYLNTVIPNYPNGI